MGLQCGIPACASNVGGSLVGVGLPCGQCGDSVRDFHVELQCGSSVCGSIGDASEEFHCGGRAPVLTPMRGSIMGGSAVVLQCWLQCAVTGTLGAEPRRGIGSSECWHYQKFSRYSIYTFVYTYIYIVHIVYI